jgi:hypothetical protein
MLIMSRTIRIITQDDDAADFVAELRVFVSGIIRLCHPAEIYLIKTDRWIGSQWLRFKGKVIGAVGRWNGPKSKHITVPPFVPHRILWERRYAAPDYKQVPIRRIVHVKTPADKGRTRWLHEVAPHASLVWYSGATASNKRGAIMAYILSNDSYWTWYTGWVSGEPWKMDEIIGLTADEIAEFRKRAEPSFLC